MHVNQRVLILLGVGICCAALAGCQEDNESAFLKSAPAAVQNKTGGPPPPKNQAEYYQQQQERTKKSMQTYAGGKMK